MIVHNRSPRRGVAIIYATVMVAVIGILTGEATHHVVTARQLLARRQNHLQAVWLARSGVELAAARLLTDPDRFRGEELAPISAGRIKITVEKSTDAWHVKSAAVYPGGDIDAINNEIERTFRRTSKDGSVRIEAATP